VKVKNPRSRAQNSGKIFVISGPSGSGKTTLLEKLLKSRGVKNLLERSISFTTRPQRRGEKESRDYFFISEAEFKRKQREEKILEWTKYLGYHYGTSRDFVQGHLARGRCIALCLDTAGAKQIKRAYPRSAVTIFIAPPSLAALRQRIEGRRRETEKSEIAKRLGLARRELAQARDYDYRLINDDFGRALDGLRQIVLKYIGPEVKHSEE